MKRWAIFSALLWTMFSSVTVGVHAQEKAPPPATDRAARPLIRVPTVLPLE